MAVLSTLCKSNVFKNVKKRVIYRFGITLDIEAMGTGTHNLETKFFQLESVNF